MINSGLAPSYFLEGLLYNVPNEHFGGSYEDTMVAGPDLLWSRIIRSQSICSSVNFCPPPLCRFMIQPIAFPSVLAAE